MKIIMVFFSCHGLESNQRAPDAMHDLDFRLPDRGFGNPVRPRQKARLNTTSVGAEALLQRKVRRADDNPRQSYQD